VIVTARRRPGLRANAAHPRRQLDPPEVGMPFQGVARTLVRIAPPHRGDADDPNDVLHAKDLKPTLAVGFFCSAHGPGLKLPIGNIRKILA
jgi:hypothetical protein